MASAGLPYPGPQQVDIDLVPACWPHTTPRSGNCGATSSQDRFRLPILAQNARRGQRRYPVGWCRKALTFLRAVLRASIPVGLTRIAPAAFEVVELRAGAGVVFHARLKAADQGGEAEGEGEEDEDQRP